MSFLYYLKSARLKRDFERNILILFTGTTFSQIISVSVTPILTRLYSPADFGVYGLLFAILAIVVNASTGKYEMAIILPERDEDGFSLLGLSLVIVFAISLIVLIIVLSFNTGITRLLGNEEISIWLYVLPGLGLLTGAGNALNYWNNRKKHFKRLALNRVARTSVTACSNLGLGVIGLGASGLILGGIVGQAFSTSLFGWQIWREDQSLARGLSIKGIKQQAHRYRAFPKFLVPSGFVETASSQFPMILISSFFGAATLGFFSHAMRMVNLPMGLVAESIRDVFRQSASEDFARNGNCRTIFLQTFKKLLILSILPFCAVLFFGPFLFGFVFGEGWKVAGEYAQIMAIMFLLRFISSPLSSIFYIAEKQKMDLIIQTMLFVVVIISLSATSYFTRNPKVAVGLYSTIYSTKYLMELYLSYRFSGNGRRLPIGPEIKFT